jgi:RNA polymerase sigma-B factor
MDTKAPEPIEPLTAAPTPDRDDERRNRFAQYASTRDPALRDELVEENLGLARILARRFADRGESYDDLFQVASIAIVSAVDRFDPERGVEFATFATRTVIGELKHHFRDKSWAVRVPRRLQELYLELGQAVSDLTQELERSPTVVELANHLRVSEQAVLEAMEAGRAYRSTSIDASDDEQETFAARLGTEETGFSGFDDRTVLVAAIRELPEREQRVIRLRFFEGLTQSEIAHRLGLSQMHVSRIIAATLERLRSAFAEHP